MSEPTTVAFIGRARREVEISLPILVKFDVCTLATRVPRVSNFALRKPRERGVHTACDAQSSVRVK